jgi:deoxyribodipyrimidine photo-lyase
MIQLVWFKRDLRIHDHAPLRLACEQGPVLALYCFEPEVLSAATYSAQHYHFAQECLEELKKELAQLKIELLVAHGPVLQTLQTLRQILGPFALHSHEETGCNLTYQRDLAVKAWCSHYNVNWREQPHHGVVRRLKNRDEWSAIWAQRMDSAPLPIPAQCVGLTVSKEWLVANSGDTQPVRFCTNDKVGRLRGGRTRALALLKSFFASRGTHYRSEMSSPLTAELACSRLSPYIALGVVSVREVMHHIWHERSELLALPPAHQPKALLASIRSMESRMHWRCHFVQKLESQPSLEFKNMHRAYDGLRQQANPSVLEAWSQGRTGVPMIDACMRMLAHTGWINFRMRAMLVSFASYQLWQPWQASAPHLAREFLDYEPGIHYSQMQMQSGTTGINTIRMYSPTKQAKDQDPDGIFIRKWLPELAKLPTEFLFEPWTTPLVATTTRLCFRKRLPIAHCRFSVVGQTCPRPSMGCPSTTRVCWSGAAGISKAR